jgi:hypothetical protein
MIALLAQLAVAATVELQVPDPLVREVILECADGTHRGQPKNGVVTFEHVPKGCQVMMLRRSGVIDSTGKWSCSLDACTKQEVQHREVVDAPNRLNVIVTTELPPGASLELTCSNGFRVREPVVTNTSVFETVPDEECTLYFKGSVPAKYRPIRAGTWSCGLSGTTAVCTRR